LVLKILKCDFSGKKLIT